MEPIQTFGNTCTNERIKHVNWAIRSSTFQVRYGRDVNFIQHVRSIGVVKLYSVIQRKKNENLLVNPMNVRKHNEQLTSRFPQPVTVTLVPAAVSWPMAGSVIGLTLLEEKSRGDIN